MSDAGNGQPSSQGALERLRLVPEPDLVNDLNGSVRLRPRPLLGRHQGLFREEQPSTAPSCPAFALPEGCNGVSVQ
jgi:hypothetical protein